MFIVYLYKIGIILGAEKNNLKETFKFRIKTYININTKHKNKCMFKVELFEVWFQ